MGFHELLQVLGVHENKDYVVRFEKWGEWGDTERHVKAERATRAEAGRVVARCWRIGGNAFQKVDMP